MSQLSLSDAFGFEAVRAAIAFLRPAGSLSSCTRGAILMTALLVGALAGIAPARAQNVFPVGVLSNTATVGVPYSSTYKCEVGFNNVNAAVCTAAPLPAGLNVVATPGCNKNSPVSSATKGAFITCTVSGTPRAAGSSSISYTGSASGITDVQVPETFNVAKGLPSVTMSAQPTSTGVGRTITFTVTVTEAHATPPTGGVGLYNATTLKSYGVYPLANGSVNITWTPMNDPTGTNNWSTGTNWFYGVYVGDDNYLGHFSNPVDISIQ